MVIARDKKVLNLYILEARLFNNIIDIMKNELIVQLWYKRLTHMSEKCLTILAKKKFLSKMKSVHLKSILTGW